MTKLTAKDEETVAMGAIGVRRDTGQLRTLLGSCIGVALYERRMKLVGLAHIVMPNSMGRINALGKYADTAIPETIEQMLKLASKPRLDLTAKIAGGANMFFNVSSNSTNTIGEQNRLAVEGALLALGIPIVAKHLGGTAGRRMVVHATSGMVQIQIVGQSIVEI